jgi:deoxyribonuclease V
MDIRLAKRVCRYFILLISYLIPRQISKCKDCGSMMFGQEMKRVLVQIPEGCVTTYGDVAKALGDVKASRAVSDFLTRNRRESHRVVTAEGRTRPWQVEPLRREGISISGRVVDDLDELRFREFKCEYPLKRLREEQSRIAKSVVLEDGFEEVGTACGFDLAYDGVRALCAFAVIEVEGLNTIEQGVISKETDFPYIPGYLAYREYPEIRAAYDQVRSDVDVLLTDGHGYAHPRRAGIACHVGVNLGKPAIGVAKSLLVGEVETPPSKREPERILDNDEMVGHALRRPTSRRPIYVSPGHLVSFESAVRVVKTVCRTRIPEPLRQAHLIATSGKMR